MRLGQLARKLEVSPTQIIDYLNSLDQSDVDGTNSKLSEDQIEMVSQKFDFKREDGNWRCNIAKF